MSISEADLTIRFTRMKKTPFSLGRNATEVLLAKDKYLPKINNAELVLVQTITLATFSGILSLGSISRRTTRRATQSCANNA
jgi:hypothetical protein